MPAFNRPVLSIVVPTRNEVDNIDELVRRLEHCLSGVSAEIVFVDDSSDQTPQAIEAVSARTQLPIVLIHRPPEQRIGGLGGAVVEGLRVARAPWVCVMDADLQHPPELIPELLDRATRDRADLVLASRYDKHSGHQGLGRARTLISRGLHTMARLMFPGKLHTVSDPLTGFFLVRREAIDADKLRPRGFKILLEILIRFPELRVAEIPFQFGNRYAGESKASTREAFNYLSHLWNLRFGENAGRLTAFALVGASGIVVNLMVLALATEGLGIYYLYSLFLATIASTVWNFCLTELWVFPDRSHSPHRVRRFSLFFIMNTAALLLRGPMVFMLTSVWVFTI
jgi:dolichol-phosphate mannosyltransferase